MRNSFRQGLISFTKSGAGDPQYLLPTQDPGFITLNVSPTPVMATFAHGDADYLEVFDETVPQAWGPLVQDKDNYLYWDIDQLTAQVAFGITTLEPVISFTEPVQIQDQHWFDLSSNTMKVWNAHSHKWLTKVRLFAGKVENGNSDQLTQQQVGSQVGLESYINAGFIILDNQLRPFHTSTGKFLTTNTDVRVKTTVGTSGVLSTPLNTFIPVRAGENIPAMSVVYFSADDTVGLASSDPALVNVKTPMGISQGALALNEMGVITQSGDITWDQWNWTGYAGKPLYIDSLGQLTTTRPQGLLAYRVGFVVNKNTILFNVDAETNPQVYSASPSEVIIAGSTPISAVENTNSIGERVVTISMTAANATAGGYMTITQVTALTDAVAQLATVATDITDLQTSKANVEHTHELSEIETFSVNSPANGQVLTFLNGEWVNGDVDFAGEFAAIDHSHDGDYAPLIHQHEIADVTGLSTALSSKSSRLMGLLSFDRVFSSIDQVGANDVGIGQNLIEALADKSPVVHTHPISQVTNLQTELDGKSDVGHTHPIGSITNLQNVLDGKAPINHAHVISDVTGLQAALDSKLDSDDAVQVLSDLTDVVAEAPGDEDVLTWDGTQWVPQALPAADLTVKPQPLVTTNITTALSFGSAAHHKTHWRSIVATGITVTVYTDELWSGTQEYWENDFNPTSPGPMPIGGTALFGKHGAGDITFVAVEGVTINTPSTLVLSRPHGKAMLVKVGPNEWDLEL